MQEETNIEKDYQKEIEDLKNKNRILKIVIIILLLLLISSGVALITTKEIKCNDTCECEKNLPSDDGKKEVDPGDEPSENPGEEPGDEPGDEPEDNPKDEPIIDPRYDSYLEVHFSNYKITQGSTNGSVKISNDKLQLSHTENLQNPGDYFEFTVDITNNGDLTAYLNTEPSIKGLENKTYLKTSITYKDNTPLKIDDKLLVNETKTLKIRIEFIKDIEEEDLPNSDTISSTIELNFISK